MVSAELGCCIISVIKKYFDFDLEVNLPKWTAKPISNLQSS